MKQYEMVLKALDRLDRLSGKAALHVDALDDKIRFQRVCRTAREARRALRVLYFDVEDAMAVATSAERSK